MYQVLLHHTTTAINIVTGFIPEKVEKMEFVPDECPELPNIAGTNQQTGSNPETTARGSTDVPGAPL